jgi:hypothetical protein
MKVLNTAAVSSVTIHLIGDQQTGAVMQYLIGQRVILNSNEIGTIQAPENKQLGYDLPNTVKEVGVFSPRKGYASHYAVHNIKPLPNGQL